MQDIAAAVPGRVAASVTVSRCIVKGNPTPDCLLQGAVQTVAVSERLDAQRHASDSGYSGPRVGCLRQLIHR